MALTPEAVQELEARFARLEQTVTAQQTTIEGLVRELAADRETSNRLVTELQAKFREQESALAEVKAVQLRLLNARILAEGRPGAGGAVDTRVLRKPSHFGGSRAAWKDWSFTFQGYCGAVSSVLEELMRQWAVAAEGRPLADCPDEERQWSLQLGYTFSPAMP